MNIKHILVLRTVRDAIVVANILCNGDVLSTICRYFVVCCSLLSVVAFTAALLCVVPSDIIASV